MPATGRLRLGLIAALVAGTTALAPAATAGAQTPPDAVWTASPVVAATADRTLTHLHGWAGSATAVRAGKRFAVGVRVSGGHRVVRLERRVHGEWRVLDRERTTAAGRASLVWRVRTAKTVVVLRVRVSATATHAGVRSAVHRVRITRPAATAATPSASPAPTPAASADEALRARLLVLVNEARATSRTCGSADLPAAPPLARSDALDRAAGAWATRMATEDFFAHESADGSTMSSRLNAVGVRNTSMRENIAAGYATAEDVMTGWLRSAGHCANLMAADVKRVGFGRASASSARYGSYWVQDFAG